MADPHGYRPVLGAIPESPGVYRFRDQRGRVIYVGKAKSLRQRLNSYFADFASLHPRTQAMLTTAAGVDWTVATWEDDAHIAASLDAARGETITHIFVTHTHRDHSPAVPKVKAATGATVYAEGPHRPARPLHVGEAGRLDASADLDFRPDITLADGSVVTGDGWTVEALTTPGHP